MRAGLVGLVLVGCTAKGGDSGLDALRDAVLLSLAERVTGAHYTDFAGRSATLAAATEAMCVAPSAETVAAAQDAWMSVREPWKRTEIVKFGPAIEYPHRLGPKLDDWPVQGDAVAELVAGGAGLSVADFASMGTATRGMPVVELLLWQGEDPAADLAADERRCAAAAGASGDVAANAEALRVAWVDDWSDRLAHPEDVDGDLYATPQDALDEWVNRMAFTVENVRVTKLGAPVGDGSGGEPRPELLESPYSGRSLRDARDALQGVADVWTGDVGGEHPGIRDLVAGSALADTVDARLAESTEALAAVPEPLSTTIQSDPAAVAAAQEPLRLLQVAIQVDLAQALGVTVTFNDNDGD